MGLISPPTGYNFDPSIHNKVFLIIDLYKLSEDDGSASSGNKPTRPVNAAEHESNKDSSITLGMIPKKKSPDSSWSNKNFP
jgi:hypothetical protein